MSVGVMEDYKLRNLRASHTLRATMTVRTYFFSTFVFLTNLEGEKEDNVVSLSSHRLTHKFCL